MSLANRFELQRLCGEIEKLVAHEELDFSYNQSGVRIAVFSGTKAQSEIAFIDAMKMYRNAKRSAKGDEKLEKAKETFLLAFDEFVKKMGY
jgi:hypothetical protein